MIPKLKEGKVRIYKSADGNILRTGSYTNPETGDALFANKERFNWVDCIEVDESETNDVHLAQVDIVDGKLFKDVDWSNKLMTPILIVVKKQKKIEKEIQEELSKQEPDVIKIIKLNEEIKRLVNLRRLKNFVKNPPDEVYQIAIDSLNERVSKGESDKPLVRKKLEDKIKAVKSGKK